MKQWVLCLILAGILGGGCRPDAPKHAAAEEKAPLLNEKNSSHPTVELQVPSFQLKEAPGVDSRSLGEIRKGDLLVLLGPVSEQVTRLTFGAQTYFQPWLLVRSPAGVEGWVHAAALGGDMPDGLRLKALLGSELAAKVADYDQAFRDMKDAVSVIAAIRQAHRVSEALTMALQVHPSDRAPEVADLLPAVTTIWMERQRSWQFFVDYTAFEAAAQQSGHAADDALLRLYYNTYPVDSIGYVYPAWKLEVDEKAVYSLLGKGIHRAYLEQLDEMSKYLEVAGPEINELKMLLINDMTEPAVLYWEDRDRVQEELKEILDTSFTVLTPSDTLALYKSLQRLRDSSAARGRRFNFRAGF